MNHNLELETNTRNKHPSWVGESTSGRLSLYLTIYPLRKEILDIINT